MKTETTPRKGLDSISIRGLWVRSKGDSQVEVLVEIDNEWRLLTTETIGDGVVSHIFEPNGIIECPKDRL
jgi:hypothetical protein